MRFRPGALRTWSRDCSSSSLNRSQFSAASASRRYHDDATRVSAVRRDSSFVMRAAQGIVRLKKKYGEARLEAACQRALDYDNPRYRTVKTILAKGLDQHLTTETAFDTLADSYTGNGRFCRNTSHLLKH